MHIQKTNGDLLLYTSAPQILRICYESLFYMLCKGLAAAVLRSGCITAGWGAIDNLVHRLEPTSFGQASRTDDGILFRVQLRQVCRSQMLLDVVSCSVYPFFFGTDIHVEICFNRCQEELKSGSAKYRHARSRQGKKVKDFAPKRRGRKARTSR